MSLSSNSSTGSSSSFSWPSDCDLILEGIGIDFKEAIVIKVNGRGDTAAPSSRSLELIIGNDTSAGAKVSHRTCEDMCAINRVFLAIWK